MVLPRNATTRVPPVGKSSRCRSKSPTTACTSTPAYSLATDAAAARSVDSIKKIGSTATKTLAPFGHTQVLISDATLFPSFTGATATNAYVTVEQTGTIPTSDAVANGCNDGCPAFFAYGSVLDNLSGDATTIEPQFLKLLTDAAINCIFNTVCKGSFTPRRPSKH